MTSPTNTQDGRVCAHQVVPYLGLAARPRHSRIGST